jgi:hypothetical protein
MTGRVTALVLAFVGDANQTKSKPICVVSTKEAKEIVAIVAFMCIFVANFTIVSTTVIKQWLHWQSMPQNAHVQHFKCTCLDFCGWHSTNRYNPIRVASTKEAKETVAIVAFMYIFVGNLTSVKHYHH